MPALTLWRVVAIMKPMRVALRLIVAALLSLETTGCSSAQKKFDEHLAGGRCEDAARAIPEQTDAGIRFLNRTRQAGGFTASYAFTGASYTAEFLWDFTTDALTLVALCSPYIALSMTVGGSMHPSNSSLCFPGKVTALNAPALGRHAFEDTAHLRCPNVDPLSRSVRRVARCFATDARETNGRAKAMQTLTALRNSESFEPCLSDGERDALAKDIAEFAAVAGGDIR